MTAAVVVTAPAIGAAVRAGAVTSTAGLLVTGAVAGAAHYAVKETFLPTLYGCGISAIRKIAELIRDILHDFECIE